MKKLSTLVLAVGTVLAAPAFAQAVTYYSQPERTTTYYTDPVTGAYVERTETVYPLPTTVYRDPAPVTYAAPVYSQPDIVVVAPRLSEDQLITRDVVDRIANDPHMSGRVGVETYRNDVTLTGRVTTPGQVDRAERDARSVEGVRDVTNLVRPRVGG